MNNTSAMKVFFCSVITLPKQSLGREESFVYCLFFYINTGTVESPKAEIVPVPSFVLASQRVSHRDSIQKVTKLIGIPLSKTQKVRLWCRFTSGWRFLS
jgi:hypothetical protein